MKITSSRSCFFSLRCLSLNLSFMRVVVDSNRKKRAKIESEDVFLETERERVSLCERGRDTHTQREIEKLGIVFHRNFH